MESHERGTHHEHSHYHIHSKERTTRFVVLLSFITMLLELYFGYQSNSRTLIVDGWHMLSHVLVLGLAWLAYFYIKQMKGAISHKQQHRIISLSGFAGAVVMLVITADIIYDSIEKFSGHSVIVSKEAFAVAVIGLLVNGLSAYFLHREEDKDMNLSAAYLHVFSDVVLSLFAITSLLAIHFFDLRMIDSILALVGSMVILKWSIDLIRKSWKEVIEIRS